MGSKQNNMDELTSRIDTKPILDLEVIKQQELFADVDIDLLTPFLEKCVIRQLEKDELLIEAGDAKHLLYLITAGRFRVHLPNDEHNPMVVLNAGQSIGEISIIDHQPASAHVIADIESRVLIIDEKLLWSMLAHSHAIAYNLLVVMAQRLRHGNSVINSIKDLLNEYEYNATVDSLTGLFNRRWLDDMLSRVMHRCHTNKHELSVLMIDIDYFKQFNDTHGHIAGDAALRSVSRNILQKLRPEDLVARYGGEELFALLPGLDLSAAESVAERLREAISTTEITTRDNQTLASLTISIGVATMQEQDRPDDLIHNADEALYRAKHAGRNRVSR
jgi:diguanylate cyclase (GGDEF)-like protein